MIVICHIMFTPIQLRRINPKKIQTTGLEGGFAFNAWLKRCCIHSLFRGSELPKRILSDGEMHCGRVVDIIFKCFV